MKIEQTSASTYFQIIESGCHKRLHSVHRPSCRAVDCDSSDIRFCNVRSPVQWLTADSITGKENAILVFKIDSRFEHCTCLHHCVAITEIAISGSNPRSLNTCCNAFRICYCEAFPDIFLFPRSNSLGTQLPASPLVGSEVKFLMRLTFADIMNRNKLLLAFLVSIDV